MALQLRVLERYSMGVQFSAPGPLARIRMGSYRTCDGVKQFVTKTLEENNGFTIIYLYPPACEQFATYLNTAGGTTGSATTAIRPNAS